MSASDKSKRQYESVDETEETHKRECRSDVVDEETIVNEHPDAPNVVFLHACASGSLREVDSALTHSNRMLLSKNSDHCAQNEANTPLHECCSRWDEEAVKVAEVLLNAGAVLNARDRDTDTPLHRACLNSRSSLVQLLIDRGACANSIGYNGRTPLHNACRNGAFGSGIVPLLIEAGAETLVFDYDSMWPMAFAFKTSGEMVKAIWPYFTREDLPNTIGLWDSISDPIGSVAVGMKLGLNLLKKDDFSGCVIRKASYAVCLSRLRTGRPLVLDNSETDVFSVLCYECADVRLWKWASSDLPHQHPITGETIFHLLCKTTELTDKQKCEVLKDLKRHRRNPLTPDFNNQLAVSLTDDPNLIKDLTDYMRWRPDRLVMEWFGPAFQERVFALLLASKRLGLYKDITHLIVLHVSKAERIYLPGKPRQ